MWVCVLYPSLIATLPIVYEKTQDISHGHNAFADCPNNANCFSSNFFVKLKIENVASVQFILNMLLSLVF